jgi:PilZ domain-containing protein
MHDCSLNGAPLQERRNYRRYPVQLAVRFVARAGRSVLASGEGFTVNISSAGMLFRSAGRLTGGEKIIAVVRWPATANGKPVILRVLGDIVWIRGAMVAMMVSHYGFFANDTYESADLESIPRLALSHYLTHTSSPALKYAGMRRGGVADRYGEWFFE